MPPQGEHAIVLQQGLAEDAKEGDGPGHQEPGKVGHQKRIKARRRISRG